MNLQKQTEPSYIACGMQEDSHSGKMVISYKVKYTVAVNNITSQKPIQSSSIHNHQTLARTTCPWTDEQGDKLWHTHQ